MSEEHFLDQPLWYNSLIRIGNKPVFFKDWLGKGVTKVRHLLGNHNNTFLSLNDFRLKYNLNAHPLSFYGIVAAVKSLRNSTWQISKDIIQEHGSFLARMVDTQRASSLVYKKLVNTKSKTADISQKKWLIDCELAIKKNINWTSAYCLARRCTKSTKLIEFHFKFLHRRMPTNNFLCKIRLQDNTNCTFCKETPETLIHLFWSCVITSSFWNDVTEWIGKAHLISADFTMENTIALGLRPDTSKFALQINYCFLSARYYIWLAKTKAKLPSLSQYLHLLKSRYEIESNGGDSSKWEPLGDFICM